MCVLEELEGEKKEEKKEKPLCYLLVEQHINNC